MPERVVHRRDRPGDTGNDRPPPPRRTARRCRRLGGGARWPLLLRSGLRRSHRCVAPCRMTGSRRRAELRQRRRQAIQASPGTPRGEIAAHPVDSATRRSRCRADEHAGMRRGIRVEPRHGSREELEQIGDAPGDRSADVVGIGALEIAGVIRWRARTPSRSRDRSARSAAQSHRCNRRPIPRARGVGIARVLPRRRSTGIELALLTTMRKGRAGWSPRHTAASAAAISSSVPPRWTVEASRHRGSRHGDRPSVPSRA